MYHAAQLAVTLHPAAPDADRPAGRSGPAFGRRRPVGVVLGDQPARHAIPAALFQKRTSRQVCIRPAGRPAGTGSAGCTDRPAGRGSAAGRPADPRPGARVDLRRCGQRSQPVGAGSESGRSETGPGPAGRPVGGRPKKSHLKHVRDALPPPPPPYQILERRRGRRGRRPAI